MDIWETVEDASRKSNTSLTTISRIIGHSRQYIHTIRGQGSVPSVDSFGMMLAACGYKLYAVGDDGDKICIDSFMDGTTYEERIADIGYEVDSE